MLDYGLGRRSAPDDRDRKFPITSITRMAAEVRQPRLLWWDGTFWPDQETTPMCVEYAWHNWVAARPVGPPIKDAPYWDYGSVYYDSQKVDEWPGEDYDGTSVRAGAKVLQSLGYIDSYLWGWSVEELIDAVRYVGPVVVGTNWYDDMFYPNSRGLIKATGSIAGGHAYLISGYNTRNGLFRGKNSWGRGWGRLGRFSIPAEDMSRLISEDGEICLAVERVP